MDNKKVKIEIELDEFIDMSAFEVTNNQEYVREQLLHFLATKKLSIEEYGFDTETTPYDEGRTEHKSAVILGESYQALCIKLSKK